MFVLVVRTMYWHIFVGYRDTVVIGYKNTVYKNISVIRTPVVRTYRLYGHGSQISILSYSNSIGYKNIVGSRENVLYL